MKDKREQELIAARAKAYRGLVDVRAEEDYRKRDEAERQWEEAHMALEDYRASKREGGK